MHFEIKPIKVTVALLWHAGNSTIEREVRAGRHRRYVAHVAGCASVVENIAQRKTDAILTFLNISLEDEVIQAVQTTGCTTEESRIDS
jgi:IS30 family transposase